MLNNIDTKASGILVRLLNSARKNGIQQGMSEEKMFVKTVLCGKGLMFKKLDIKGRSRMGIIRVPKCSVKLVIEEMHPVDYYKMMVKGNSPPGMGRVMKTLLAQSEADFDKVKELSYMTTSRGRYYRKT